MHTPGLARRPAGLLGAVALIGALACGDDARPTAVGTEAPLFGTNAPTHPRSLHPRADGAHRLALSARSSGKPDKQVFRVDETEQIPAGTPWDSPVRVGETCDFDLMVHFDEVITVWVFDDHELIQIELGDTYTNLSTGYSFVDPAHYSIRFDYATGLAFHEGVFWQVNAQGPGIEVLDVGAFVQDWNAPFPEPVVSLTGNNHDVNGQPYGTYSYCDWAQGLFP
jgi:hypothetical protein